MISRICVSEQGARDQHLLRRVKDARVNIQHANLPPVIHQSAMVP